MSEHTRLTRGSTLGRVATQASRHPALVAYVVVWSTAVMWLIFRDRIALGAGAIAAFLVVLCWSGLTVRITEPDGTDTGKVTGRRKDPIEASDRRAIHLVIVCVFVVLTAHQGLVFHDLIPESWLQIPGWSALVARMSELARGPLGMPATYLVNPVTYFVLPFLALLLAGVRPRALDSAARTARGGWYFYGRCSTSGP